MGKYINPFKNGKLKNSGVDIKSSRKRLSAKLEKVRNKYLSINIKGIYDIKEDGSYDKLDADKS